MRHAVFRNPECLVDSKIGDFRWQEELNGQVILLGLDGKECRCRPHHDCVFYGMNPYRTQGLHFFHQLLKRLVDIRVFILEMVFDVDFPTRVGLMRVLETPAAVRASPGRA